MWCKKGSLCEVGTYVCVCSSIRLQSLHSSTVNSANLDSSRHLSLSLAHAHTRTHAHTEAHTHMSVPPSELIPKSVQVATSKPCVPILVHIKTGNTSSNIIFTTVLKSGYTAVIVCYVLCVACKDMEVLMSE